MGRAPCCDKASVKRGPWSPEEDLVLKSYVEKHGTGGNWIALPQKAGLKRCGKSCRLRWLNYLRPDIKHGGFTEEEDNVICSLYRSIGSRWSAIASRLPGRTDNDVKNHWNTKLKKKMLMAGVQVDAGANSRHRPRVRRSSSPSPPVDQNHGHGSSSASAYSGSSPSTLSSMENYGAGGIPEPASFPVPSNPPHQASASQDTSAASSSLATDHSIDYAPWFDNGGAGFDAFMMDVGMGPMEYPTAGDHGFGELVQGEVSMADLWANAQSRTEKIYQSITYF